MAEDRSVGGLFLRLGLSLSELETGFVNAGQTIAANINRLNREAELVRIRSEIEIAGLDETADAERILQVRQEALNRQMEIQRDRVRILDAELQNLIRTQGENSVAAQRATTTLERAHLALANLERESRNLNDSSGETNNIFGELNDMLPSMPTKLQAVGMAFGAITAGIGAAGAAVNELREEFKELQNQAYELNMPVPDTRKFLREMRLAGGDIGDFEGYIRGITDAWTKGEYDDPEFIALRKYGAEITDATGRLKDFKDISEEVYQAWLKADAAGEGIEFLQLTGGESGIRDAIQYFQRLKEAREDAAKIFQAEIDDKQLHELDRAMNLVEEQSKELKAALGDIFIPAAQSAAENFFNVLHDGTEYLVENKNEIQRWGYITAEVFEIISGKVGDFVDKLGEIAKTPKGTTGNAEVDKMMSGMGWRYQDFNQQTPWGVNTQWDKFNEETRKSYGIFSDEVKRADEKLKALNDTFNATNTVSDKVIKGLAALKDKNPLNQYDWKRINAFKEELEGLRIELDYADDAYKKAIAQLDLWRQRERGTKNFLSDEEAEAIDNLYSAKLEQIEKEHADELAKAHEEATAKIQEYWKNAADIEFELTHSAYEKQIRDIEEWEKAERERAKTKEEIAGIVAEAAAKEAQAFEREVDRIKGVTQSLEDEIFDMEHSQYEADMRRAMQKYQKALEDGVDFSVAQRWLNDKFKEFNTRAKESRSKDGDCTKNPNGTQSAIQWNGLAVMQSGISLMTDENQIRSRLITTLDEAAQAEVERIQSLKGLTSSMTMPQMPIPDNLQGVPVTGGFSIIEGDEYKQISIPDLKSEIEKMQRQMAEYLNVPMPDISQYMPPQSAVQLPAQETMTFETIVTPLNSIHTVVSNILSAMQNQQPQQITVSPSISNNLGGAYVFDNAMKKSLVDDITSDVVDEITQAVTQATSRASYSYGA